VWLIYFHKTNIFVDKAGCFPGLKGRCVLAKAIRMPVAIPAQLYQYKGSYGPVIADRISVHIAVQMLVCEVALVPIFLPRNEKKQYQVD
jgi:hypothetical protein